MYKIEKDNDVEMKYSFRLKCHDEYKNDCISRQDLNGSILELKDKYNSIDSISGSPESFKYIISFKNPKKLDNDSEPIINDINDILKSYLINQGLEMTSSNFLLFDFSKFSSFIEIRL